ncbi:hypothetical protein KRMM14A1259_10520 [Krasilnikovia sp. MM14-A1259]
MNQNVSVTAFFADAVGAGAPQAAAPSSINGTASSATDRTRRRRVNLVMSPSLVPLSPPIGYHQIGRGAAGFSRGAGGRSRTRAMRRASAQGGVALWRGSTQEHRTV